MHLDHDFFYTNPSNSRKKKKKLRTPDKTPEEERINIDEDEEMGVSRLLTLNLLLYRLLHIHVIGDPQEPVEEVKEPQWLGKTNFVEIRSFWQIFRSFDRMWSFLILSLQVVLNQPASFFVS